MPKPKKQPPCLYSVLDVPKTTTPDKLKKAHRRKAMETHPDRGGSREQFALVQLAWDILSDPARRKAYDETGEVVEPVPDNSDAQFIALFNEAFANVFQGLANSGRNPTQSDILSGMRNWVRGRIDASQKQIDGCDEGIKIFRKIQSRTKDPKGLLLAAIDAQIDKTNQHKDLHTRLKTAWGKVLQYLDDVGMDWDKPPQAFWGTATTSASVGTW